MPDSENQTPPNEEPIAPTPAPPAPVAPATEAQINMQSLQDRLALYVKEMQPNRPTNPEEGAQHQAALWTIIKFVLNRKGSQFVALYAQLLATVLEHRRGCFNERYVYRFHDNLRMSNADRRNFARVLNLLLTTCDPKTRQLSLRQIDLTASLRDLADNEMQQRVVGFYHL